MGIFDATPLALCMTVLQEINFVIMVISCLIYSLTILSTGPLRSNNLNLLTVNVCFSIIIYALDWTIFVILTFLPSYFQMVSQGITCNVLRYMQTVVNSQVIYSYVIVGINRIISIIYFRQRFFQSFKWTFICLSVQWTIGFLVPLPQLYQNPFVSLFLAFLYDNKIYCLVILGMSYWKLRFIFKLLYISNIGNFSIDYLLFN
jgi:hypothetical protein